MSLDLHDCSVAGVALPEPFLRFELADLLARRNLLPSGRAMTRLWEPLRRQLRALGGAGGPLRVHNHVIAPLARCLGYAAPERCDPVATREGPEDGGWSLHAPNGTRLRAWSVGSDTDLDVAPRHARAYRLSPTRRASRILHQTGETLGLLTDGQELRLLVCHPSRADSHLAIPLAGRGGWTEQSDPPDSYRLLLALAGPAGVQALPGIADAARLSQARVTKELRVQARAAIEGFVQSVLDDPANASALRRHRARDRLAQILWHESLILIYRLLFVLKLESGTDLARAFSFAGTRLWREAFSPNQALGQFVRQHLDHGLDTGLMLSDGLRTLFGLFRDGLSCSEVSIAPLGGALFGVATTPLLDSLHWPERGAALLLDRLLWTRANGRERQRVQYGPLHVEELGRVYEALLELEPGIASEPMARQRRARLEAVVPAVNPPCRGAGDATGSKPSATPRRDIPQGAFYLCAGRGRKATGSYYTPHDFVRYLVEAALAPVIAACSPEHAPSPAAILALNIVDPATGSGHFLVEACRFLGEALHTACRQCDTLAACAEAEAANAPPAQRQALLAQAAAWRCRVAALPDPDQTLLAYLPEHAVEGTGSGVSQERARAMCRRLVAVHCLYGVDRNPLAIELAKLSLWLESYAEGLPLTFLDHRLVCGDSLSGPFFARLGTFPVGGGALDPLLARGVSDRLAAALDAALAEVRALQVTVGRNAGELLLKQQAMERLDHALHPLRQLARAWSGAAMLAFREADDEYLALAQAVAVQGTWPAALTRRQARLLAAGAAALPWDLTFPEVFLSEGGAGFDAVLGNPPWDIVQQNAKEFLAGYDLAILDAPTEREARAIRTRLLAEPRIAAAFRAYQDAFVHQHRVVARLYAHQKAGPDGQATGGKLDAFRVFAERALQLAGPQGVIGMVVPSSFHANEGATGIRRLYLDQTDLQACFSFENTNRLFDINLRQKFALVLARRPGPTRTVRCGFYLDDLGQIGDPGRVLSYDRAFIDASGGAYLNFLELRSGTDLAIARRVFLRHVTLLEWTARRGIVLGRELNITDDAHRLVPLHGTRRLRCGHLLLQEGKTIQQYDDRWETPRYAVPLSALQDKPAWQDAARYFRLALRRIARSTDERTAIAAMTAPGSLFSITTTVERTPAQRGHADALVLCAVLNSFVFDWALRQKTAATVNLFLLEACPVCDMLPAVERFLAHGALRLSCNHATFAPLWQEQLGAAWHERGPCETWPAIAAEPERWQLRAAMDAVVAHCYGLARADYAHVLGSFAHKHFPPAPGMCLDAFDLLATAGLDAFCGMHDPYQDIPLVGRLAAFAPLPLRRT